MLLQSPISHDARSPAIVMPRAGLARGPTSLPKPDALGIVCNCNWHSETLQTFL